LKKEEDEDEEEEDEDEDDEDEEDEEAERSAMAMADSELSISSSPDLSVLLGLPPPLASDCRPSTPLSASDLRSLMNRMSLRSQQLKSRLRDCISSQRRDFTSLVARSASSLSAFSQISDGFDPILSQDLVGLCSRLLEVVQETRSTNSKVVEKRKALLVVEKISDLYRTLEQVKTNMLEGEIEAGVQSLISVKAELGISNRPVDDGDKSGLVEDEIIPFDLLRKLWLDRFTEVSVVLVNHECCL
jgi:hypothetical protein